MGSRHYMTADVRYVTPDFLLAYIERCSEGAFLSVEDDAWIHGAGGVKWAPGDALYCDDGTDFCPDCAEKRLAAILKKYPKHNGDLTIGISDTQEHDTPPFCVVCGVKLRCSLSDYGFEEELEALTTYAIPTTPNEWAWLAEVLDSVGAGDTSLVSMMECPVPDGHRPRSHHVPGGLEASIHNRWVRTWRAVAKAIL
jgi:hypothetical protein